MSADVSLMILGFVSALPRLAVPFAAFANANAVMTTPVRSVMVLAGGVMPGIAQHILHASLGCPRCAAPCNDQGCSGLHMEAIRGWAS